MRWGCRCRWEAQRPFVELPTLRPPTEQSGGPHGISSPPSLSLPTPRWKKGQKSPEWGRGGSREMEFPGCPQAPAWEPGHLGPHPHSVLRCFFFSAEDGARPFRGVTWSAAQSRHLIAIQEGSPGVSSGKESVHQCRRCNRHRFSP